VAAKAVLNVSSLHLSMLAPDQISLKIEFGGGLELLFSNQRSHRLSIPTRVPIQMSGPSTSTTENTGESTTRNNEDIALKPADVQFLIFYLRDHLLKERPQLFVEDNTVYVATLSSFHP
jgi:ubiquitin related modifier 1